MSFFAIGASFVRAIPRRAKRSQCGGEPAYRRPQVRRGLVFQRKRGVSPVVRCAVCGGDALRMGGPLASKLVACGVYQPSVEQCEDSAKMDVWFPKFVDRLMGSYAFTL